MPQVTELAPIQVEQPGGEPIALNDKYGAVAQFRLMSSLLVGNANGVVPAHIVAITAQNANSLHISTDELTGIVRNMNDADTILRTTPSAPVIYRLHCADGFAVTPEAGTSGIRQVNTAADRGSEHMQTVVDTAKQYTLQGGGRGYSEQSEVVIEDAPLEMYHPLSFLVSGHSQDVRRFVTHDPHWMRYPNSHVVVGQAAVDAFLKAQAERDLLGEHGALNHEAVTTSWAMLASAGLQRVGYTSSIGKHGDVVHRASIEGLADVVASGLGYKTKIGNRYVGDDDMFIRRVSGVEFDVRADAQEVGAKATERLFSDETQANRFQGLLHGDRDHVEAYMTETAGNFMTRLLDAE